MTRKIYKLKSLFLGAFLTLLLSPFTNAQEVSISSGHLSLQNKDYQSAFDIYLALVNEGHQGLSLYYNTGIAAFELGKYPESILYFEKALELSPTNAEVQHNLQLAYKKTEQEFIEVEPFFLNKWWKSFYLALPATAWTIILFLFLLFTIASFYFYQFGKTEKLSKMGMRIFFPFLMLVFIFFMAGMNRTKHIKANKYAILMAPSELFIGPDRRSEELYELKAGSKILILDELEGWLKIELINKEEGWIEESNLERI